MFQADKSAACLLGQPILLRLEDLVRARDAELIQTVALAPEIADELIMSYPQPLGKPNLTSGFNVGIRLAQVLNDALLLRRRLPGTVEAVLAELGVMAGMQDRALRIVLDLPELLQLRLTYNSRLSRPEDDWEAKLQRRFQGYFQSPGHGLNAFLVMQVSTNQTDLPQGNILVTQHLVRLVLYEARETLLAQLSRLTQTPILQVIRMVGPAESAEDLAYELLDGLNSLPVDCVAANGPSLVRKGEDDGGSVDVSAVHRDAVDGKECTVSRVSWLMMRNTANVRQQLLLAFVTVLSVIEDMYAFGGLVD